MRVSGDDAVEVVHGGGDDALRVHAGPELIPQLTRDLVGADREISG